MAKRYWYDFEDCDGQKMVDFKEDKKYSLETVGDFMMIENLLNEQDGKIERFAFILQESIRNERTSMGKMVLKQLADNLGVKYE